MKYTYKEKTSDTGWKYIERSDGASIPFDENNADYQAYLNPAINEASTK